MEDRFKFRAHFPNKKGIMQNKPIHYLKWFKQNELLAELITFETIDGSRANYNKDEIILMQCTGLKDKNGKLIFEGDILNLDDGDEWVVGRAILVFEQGCFCLKDIKDYKSNYSAIFQNQVPLINGRVEEIIGNIYENTELLEAKCTH